MHTHSLDRHMHDHVFLGAKHDENARRTWLVVALTLAMMISEIAAGSFFGSMALLADGWHMGTHAAALGIAGAAYLFARRQSGDTRFSFGTGKFGDLAAFSSALILGMIALQIAYESVMRLISPVSIHYAEAIAVACLGLAVNLVSAFLLRGSHGHRHGHTDVHDHDHAHDHHHHRDNNFRAAYVHVLADAVTSLLAIAALAIAMVSGWTWTDPAVGLIGSIVIASWAYTLIAQAGGVLLDVSFDKKLERAIRARLETGDDRVTDLHVWQLGPGHCAAVISLISDAPLQPAIYKERLGDLKGLSHVTVEVERCMHAQTGHC